MIHTAKLPIDGTIFCSSSSKTVKLFGHSAKYATDEQIKCLSHIIHKVNEGKFVEMGLLEKIVGDVDSPVFACTEISMIAHRDGLAGYDNIEATLDKIILSLGLNDEV